MSASRMKNLILLILTLCALGLLCIVVPNRLAQTHEQRQMLQELKTLYESYGLSVLLDELPRSPVLYSVELSEDGAQTAAQALLGAKAAPAGESGFESTYESELGTLHITRTGGFSAVMTGGSRVRSSEKAAEKLLRAMDFQYQTLTREQTETGAVQIRTSQTLLGVPVLGSQLALTYTDDCLTAVEGTFYTGGSSITRVSEQESISAADALAQLLARRDALGWVGRVLRRRICRPIRPVRASASCRSGWSKRTREAFLSTALRAKSRRKHSVCRLRLSNYEENLKISCCCIVIFLYIPAVVCYSNSGRIWLC